jgi:hypothetical protein
VEQCHFSKGPPAPSGPPAAAPLPADLHPCRSHSLNSALPTNWPMEGIWDIPIARPPACPSPSGNVEENVLSPSPTRNLRRLVLGGAVKRRRGSKSRRAGSLDGWGSLSRGGIRRPSLPSCDPLARKWCTDMSAGISPAKPLSAVHRGAAGGVGTQRAEKVVRLHFS